MTIHHSKTEWSEVMEVQPFSSHLRMLIGTGFISLTADGCVRVYSTSLPHLGDRSELSAQVQLPSSGTVTIARTHVTQSKVKTSSNYISFISCEQSLMYMHAVKLQLVVIPFYVYIG